MPDMATLERYCRDTSSALFLLVAAMLEGGSKAEPQAAASSSDEAGPVAQAAGPAGIAYAFTGLIRAFSLHAAQGRVYAPADLLQRHGSSREEAVGGRASPALLAAIAAWRGEARRHLAAAKANIAGLPNRLKPAFLPLSLCEPYLRLAEARGYDPFRTPIELPQWRRQWILWRG
jgi:phytoene synthase